MRPFIFSHDLGIRTFHKVRDAEAYYKDHALQERAFLCRNQLELYRLDTSMLLGIYCAAKNKHITKFSSRAAGLAQTERAIDAWAPELSEPAVVNETRPHPGGNAAVDKVKKVFVGPTINAPVRERAVPIRMGTKRAALIDFLWTHKPTWEELREHMSKVGLRPSDSTLKSWLYWDVSCCSGYGVETIRLTKEEFLASDHPRAAEIGAELANYQQIARYVLILPPGLEAPLPSRPLKGFRHVGG